LAPPLQQRKPRLDARWRQLEVVGRPVTIGARTPVRLETIEPVVEERDKTARDGVARFTATIARSGRSDARVGIRAFLGNACGVGSQQQRDERERADNDERGRVHGRPPGGG
jgi:hypothetical protein